MENDKFQDAYETPDISEFLANVSKRFCPNCGVPIEKSHNGRPRVYCSDKCRRDFWEKHPRIDTWNSYETLVCPICQRVFRAKKLSTRQRKYCSRSCAGKARWLEHDQRDGDQREEDTDGIT